LRKYRNMKSQTLYLVYTLIVIAISVFKDYDVSKGQWKIREGKGSTGDWIEFKNQSLIIKADTKCKSLISSMGELLFMLIKPSKILKLF